LDRVELNNRIENGTKKIDISYFFQDADGDAITADFEVISTNRQGGVNAGDGKLNKGDHQKTLFKQVGGAWGCPAGDETYEAELSLTIVDEEGLRSNSKTFKLICD